MATLLGKLLEKSRSVLGSHDRPKEHRRYLCKHREHLASGRPKLPPSVLIGTSECSVDVDEDRNQEAGASFLPTLWHRDHVRLDPSNMLASCDERRDGIRVVDGSRFWRRQHGRDELLGWK